jgi:hypothetical protein
MVIMDPELDEVAENVRFRISLAEEALKDVNALRTEYGYPAIDRLPRGDHGSTSRCPIAKALNVGWAPVISAKTIRVYFSHGPMIVRPTPAAMERFIRAFDRRELPEYDASYLE